MRDEDLLEVPDSWRHVIHARRNGMRGIAPETIESSDELNDFLDLVARRSGKGIDFEIALQEILEHPGSDPELTELARSTDTSALADGVRLALAPSPLRETFWWSHSLAPVRDLVARRGLVHAVETFVHSCAYEVCRVLGVSGASPLVRRTEADDVSAEAWPSGVWTTAAFLLRSTLATATDSEYQEVREALSRLRSGLFRQRIVTSYLMPDMTEWADADHAELPRGYRGPGEMLFFCSHTRNQFERFYADRLDQFVTAYDVLGDDAVVLLAEWLRQGRATPSVRQDALDVLSRIPSDLAFDALLHHLEISDVAGSVVRAADRFPRRAATLLESHRDGDRVDVLLVRHRGAHPEAFDASSRHVPDAASSAVPALLASPPWTKMPPPRVAVTLQPDMSRAAMLWLDGEQEQWAYDWKAFLAEDMLRHLPLADRGTAPPEFYISAPAESVRPFLARWQAEAASFYLQQPRVLVGKYELDALPPILRLARRKPVVGGELLLPYRTPEVAELMAEWLARSAALRPIAHQWFSRHGSDAAALLLPVALGAPAHQSRTAALALHRIDREDVLTAAERVGCAEAVDNLLAGDPLDLVPARVPAPPKWADPAYLPQVLLAGGARALPTDAVRGLLRMIAISQPDAPYEGIGVVASACDPDSLAVFAWHLFRLWEGEGRPSKSAWAMDALGYLGNDETADRLAPLVRRWPSEGAAPRAKRGVDALASIGTERALGHLSNIARNAKSAPLRAHASAALDRVAAQIGLLPEQLDDLLAPDLGLDAEHVEYRATAYRVELDVAELVLIDPEGRSLRALPKPATDDERAVATAWTGRRRKAKPLIADQLARLEEAMTVQRQWTVHDFRTRVVAHSLLGRLARGLIWTLDDRMTAAIDSLGDLVDPRGGLRTDAQWVRLSHPAVDDLTAWHAWLVARGVAQPVPQIEREVFTAEDPSMYWGRTVDAARLFALPRHGWCWGPSGRRALRQELYRPFGAVGRVVLTLDPGVSAVVNPAGESVQTITGIDFESTRGELGVFTDLPKVTRSELIRSLRTLD